MKPLNPSSSLAGSPAKRALQAALLALLPLTLATSLVHAADTTASSSSGVVSGLVTNKTTGNGLIGASVQVPALGVSTLVDNTGRYLLNLPPGSHEIVVSYSGLDSERSTVTVSAGHPAVKDFVMGSAVLMLDAFKVASEKEGAA